MKTNVKTRKLVITAMMIAVTIVLASTPIGIINLVVVSATTTHIAVIIAAILEGPIVGSIVGAVFGLYTIFRAITSPTGILDPYFVNPVISVLPRMLIGITSYYAYKFILKLMEKSKSKEIISICTGAVVGSATNTIGVLGLLYVIYFAKLSQAIQESFGASINQVFLGIITTSGIAEMVVSAIVATAVIATLKKALYK